MNNYRFLVLFALACTMTATSVGWAQSFTASSPLAFGKFVRGEGTVTIPVVGVRTSSGVLLVPSGDGAPATFNLSGGGASQAYTSITLPSNGQIFLSNGPNTMAVNSFTSSISMGSGQLSGSGALTFKVGATLSVSNTQALGSYSGNFGVTINFP